MTLPTVMTISGAQPRSPAELRTAELAIATALSPGLTANLPGSLIDDISGTQVGGLAVCDSAKVELINSLTPYGANDFLLNQLGQVYGVPKGTTSNTSVYCVFSGPPGFIIAKGFIVSDGTYQYSVMDGGVIGGGGTSPALFCLAVLSGIWAIAIGTVTQLITSIPSPFVVTVTNPQTGTPGGEAETSETYRPLVLQAGLSVVQGLPQTLKKLLDNVSGVQSRLISVLQQSGGGWEILVGGGDPYEIGNAIYTAVADISSLVGSIIDVGRNQTITLTDYPNLYSVVFVVPPLQTVSITVTWNTTANNFIANSAIQQLGAPALLNYVNSIVVGQPMNLFEMEDIFRTAVSIAIPPNLLTRMIFAVQINGVLTPPISGTGIIEGDPESYFFTTIPSISIARG